MENEKLVIHYTRHNFTGFVYKDHIKLYENGLVQIVESNNRSIEKIVSQKNIGKEKVQEYANKLIAIGFHNCEPEYKDHTINGKTKETLTLEYNGHNKSVQFENTYGFKQLDEVINELIKLMK